MTGGVYFVPRYQAARRIGKRVRIVRAFVGSLTRAGHIEGRSPTAISLKNNDGGHRRGRPCLVGRAMTKTDNAAVLFFRAVARDRHPTPACTACRTLSG